MTDKIQLLKFRTIYQKTLYKNEKESLYLCFFNFSNVYLFLRERQTECEWGRGRERRRHRILEKETQNPKQAPGLTLGSNSGTTKS